MAGETPGLGGTAPKPKPVGKAGTTPLAAGHAKTAPVEAPPAERDTGTAPLAGDRAHAKTSGIQKETMGPKGDVPVPLPPPVATPPKAVPVDAAAQMEKNVAAIVTETTHDSMIGQSVEFWHQQRQEEGAAGYVGAVMEGLLEFSGMAALDRSSAEVGARIGLDDSAKNIAKASGKMAFDAGMVALNGVAAGKALGSAGVAVKTALAGEAAVEVAANGAQIVRHYTTVEKAMQIMESGEIWASKRGVVGGNKIYLLAEQTGERGMNMLRRMNIGVPPTGAAIEIDLAKLPAELAKRFQTEGFRGFLNQENFVTHVGAFDFKAFRDAVKYVDTEAMKVTFDQVLKAGGRLTNVAGAFVDAAGGMDGLTGAKR